MNKIARVIVVLIILMSMAVFFAPIKSFAVGNTYYVRTDGNDSHTGLANDAAHAWLTPQHAASTVAVGDIVNIVAGTYNTTQFTITTSGTAGNPITFQNYSGGTVIIDGTGAGISEYGICNVFASYITISGITFRNSPDYGIFADSDSATRTGITIQNNTVHNCGSSGIAAVSYYDNAVQIGNLSYVTITGNIVYTCNTSNNFESISLVGVNYFTVSNNIEYGNTYAAGAGIDAKVGCTNGDINGNTVYGNASPGIYLDARGTESNIRIFDNLISGNSGAGIALADENNVNVLTAISIYNNILYGNDRGVQIAHNTGGTEVINFSFINNTLYDNNDSDPEGEILIESYSGNLSACVIRNNIIFSLTDGKYAIDLLNNPSATNLTIDHNLFYNSGGSWNVGSTQGTSQVTSNPLFISPTTNFALQSTSPAINVGSSTSAPATDYIGTSRPQGAGYDIGAYEYIITPATISTSAVSNITDTTATLNGNISSMGSETSLVVTFEYGLTTSYGQTATAAESPMTTTGTVHANVTGLSTGSVCHFRVKVVGVNTTYSADAQFTTTGTAGTNPFLFINQITRDNYVIGSGKNDNLVINNYSSGGTTTTTTTSTTTTSTITTTGTPIIPTSTGSLLVKYLLPLAIILVTIFMVFRYWRNPILLICYFIGLMLMLILALNFMNIL